MASDPADFPSATGVSVPALPSAPPPQPTRGQAMQRLQVGIFGLGSMVLLVGLASVVLTNARQNQAQVVPEAAPTVAPAQATSGASDPLADAGIVPELTAKEPPLVTPPPVSDALAPQP